LLEAAFTLIASNAVLMSVAVSMFSHCFSAAEVRRLTEVGEPALREFGDV